MSDTNRSDTSRSDTSRPGSQSLPLHDSEASWRRWQMDELSTTRQPESDGGPSPSETARRKAAFQRQAEQRALREKVIEQARAQGHREGFDAGHAEGHAEGLAKGFEEGHEQARQAFEREARETLAPMAPLAMAFSEALSQLDEDVANELVELALATGRQLAGEALKSRPRQVLEIVRGLLHSEPAMAGKPRLWLHPLDHKLVQQHLGQEMDAAGWTLQPDDAMTRGGCRVASASGELDATWESRWETVKRQVRHRRPAATGDGDNASRSDSGSGSGSDTP
ncbi:flagellar assembly protein FliH [Halomonas urumqiensis]|uniref:Flagellar assembly protein FliH n=1 Tax=Halomonas urumqiensis TaxID=1684789 RepID=A0A2N7UNU8_9GAMM|nr:flagellar assembly protein FliH [Halomonas urumqiensis]PMR82086.1 flagellar assembly protein FliH [Halomonas urumqiensis]PTB02582.1 flagellar assembly protein FliH [Halomonas urumqiensis]GHE21063.1 flagellar assembly protein FliH [Halomonas urumqiensis]